MSPKQSLLSSKLATRLTRRLLSQKRRAVFQHSQVTFLSQKMLHFHHLQSPSITMKLPAPYLLLKHIYYKNMKLVFKEIPPLTLTLYML